MMPVQQLIEICSVSVSNTGGLGDIPTGGLQQLDKILLFKLASSLGQGRDFLLVLLNCVMEQIFCNER